MLVSSNCYICGKFEPNINILLNTKIEYDFTI